MGAQSRRALVLWALEVAEEALADFEAERPFEARPRIALERSAAWARGEIRMPEARRAILNAHAAAKDAGDRRLAVLAHAIGQAASTVHVKTHAKGFVFYELTAIRLRAGEDWEAQVLRRIGTYEERLLFWRERSDDPERRWAKFLAGPEA